MAMFASIALIGASPAFAEIDGYEMETVNWITGESIERTTINATCGEKQSEKLQFTYFDDYVHVVTIENGQTDLQRYYNYYDFVDVLNDLVLEVKFC